MIRFQSLKEVWGNYVRYFWVNVPNRENRENREGGEKQLLRAASRDNRCCSRAGSAQSNETLITLATPLLLARG